MMNGVEVIELELSSLQVVDVDYVDERLEVIEDVDCVHVDDVDCSCILDVDRRC